jgi:hypothetical protein
VIQFLILALTALGCGALFPAPAGDSRGFIGFRFMAGIAAAMVVLYLGNAVAGIPLTLTAYGVAAMAGLGLLRLGPEIYARRFSRACLLHPVLILLVVIGVVIARRGGVEYLPWQGDEYERWVYFAKLAFLTDGNWTETFRISYRGHTPGWTILLAYPSLVLGRFSEADAALLPFIVHVGFLGIIYDISRRAAERIEMISFRGRMVVAWLVVLILLLAGTSGKLVPILLNGEPSHALFLGACFAGALCCMNEVQGRTAMMALIGLFAAAAFLVMMSALALVPALIIFSVFLVRAAGGDGPAPRWCSGRRGLFSDVNIKLAGLLWLPLLLVVASWMAIESPSPCLDMPGRLPDIDLPAVLFFDGGLEPLAQFSSAIMAFLGKFKLPLTMVGALGIVVGLIHRQTSVVSLMIVMFVMTGVTAAYYFHLACVGDFNDSAVISILRSATVWLRQIHVFGFLMLFLAVLAWAGRMQGGLWEFRHKGAVIGIATVVAMTLLAWQAIMATRSFAFMAKQYRVGYSYRGHPLGVVKWVPREAAALKAALKKSRLADARVLMISQGTTRFPLKVARYHALAAARGEPVFAYRLSPEFSWGERPANRFMRKTTIREMSRTLGRHRVIWPYILDDWMRGALAEIVADPACRKNPERYFLLRRGPQGAPYVCVVK